MSRFYQINNYQVISTAIVYDNKSLFNIENITCKLTNFKPTLTYTNHQLDLSSSIERAGQFSIIIHFYFK